MTDGTRKTSERWTALLHGRLDGALSPAEAAELERITASDPEAARELAAFEAMSGLSRAARPEPPADFTARVMSRVARPDPLPEAFENPIARFFRSFLPDAAWRPALGGAFAVAAIAILLALYVRRPIPQITPEAPSSTTTLVTHRFELTAPKASTVCLVGSFNDWKVCEAPLVRDPKSGTWSVQVELPPGRHEYMFVVDDNDWETDPGADIKVDDGFGHENAVVFL